MPVVSRIRTRFYPNGIAYKPYTVYTLDMKPEILKPYHERLRASVV